MEDAFFNGQPVSVRKTVEFVSERVASACVKQICHDVVPDFKQTSLKELDNMLKVLHENGGISKQVCKIRYLNKTVNLFEPCKIKFKNNDNYLKLLNCCLNVFVCSW